LALKITGGLGIILYIDGIFGKLVDESAGNEGNEMSRFGRLSSGNLTSFINGNENGKKISNNGSTFVVVILVLSFFMFPEIFEKSCSKKFAKTRSFNFTISKTTVKSVNRDF